MPRSRTASPLSVVRRKVVLIPAALIVLVLVVLLGIFLLQASRASTALHQARDNAQTLKDTMSKGDITKSKVQLAALQKSTETARSQTQGPIWKVAGKLPFVGTNIEAISTVSRVLDDLADNGLPPVVNVAATVDTNTFSPKKGRVDLKPMSALAPAVAKASVVLAGGDRELATVDTTTLIGRLQQPVKDLQKEVHDAYRAANSAGTALKLMPTMLGGKGQRTYLVIFQNNAEIRATGGLPGAWATIKVKDGKLKLGEQGSAVDLPPLDKPIKALTREETEIYTPKLGKDFRDTNFTPDWPRAADLAQAIFKHYKGTSVDGVFSIDPVALSYALKGTGSVKLADGTKLTSDNAVDQLLNQVYVDYSDPAAQDAYFASAAKEIFDALSSGIGDSTTVVSQLAKAAGEGRVLVWSKDKTEQSVLQDTQIAGALRGDTGKTPQVGVYLNDGTGAKMDYYLETTNDVRSQQCTADGVQSLVTTTTLKSTAPSDAKRLPRSIIGPGFGSPTGSMLVNLRAYAPFGGSITGATINGKKSTLFSATQNGRPIGVVSALLKPGDSQVITFTMRTGKGQTNDPKLTATPGVNTRNETPQTSCGQD